MKNTIFDWFQSLALMLTDVMKMNIDAVTLEDNGRNVSVCLWKGKPTYLESIKAWMPPADGACLGKIRTDAFLSFDAGRLLSDAKFSDLIVDISGIKDIRKEKFNKAMETVRTAFGKAGIPFTGTEAGNIDGTKPEAVALLYSTCAAMLRRNYLKSVRFNAEKLEFNISEGL